jgi:putative endonuclease
MFYYTYILQSLKNNSLYIGYSSNLKKRFESHNTGKNQATKPFIPYQLIYYEAFLNRIDAKNREVYLKSGYGRRSIPILLNHYLKTESGRTLLKKHEIIHK